MSFVKSSSYLLAIRFAFREFLYLFINKVNLFLSDPNKLKLLQQNKKLCGKVKISIEKRMENFEGNPANNLS